MQALMRSRTDRKIAGICGGIAQQNGWDPTVVRLIWVALVLFAGTGVLAYIVLWVVIPEEPYGMPMQQGYPPPPQAYGTPYPPPTAGPYPGGQTYQGAPYGGSPAGTSSPVAPHDPGAPGESQYRG